MAHWAESLVDGEGSRTYHLDAQSSCHFMCGDWSLPCTPDDHELRVILYRIDQTPYTSGAWPGITCGANYELTVADSGALGLQRLGS
ncbi:MAG: hypothetical protein ACYDBQ_06390 [Thermoplasmatota archaeon]